MARSWLAIGMGGALRTIIFFTALVLSGCAGTTVKHVSQDKDHKASGIRYYEPAPFLLVYSDARGNLNSEVIIMPDLTRMRSIDPYAYLASNKTTLNFTNGILTQGKTVVDETILPKGAFEAVKAIAGTIAGATFDTAGGDPTLPAPKLFRIYVDEDGIAQLIEAPTVGPDGEEIRIKVKFTKKEDKKEDAS